MSKRVSLEQLELLWSRLNGHRNIAMGYNKSLEAREMSRKMWQKVARFLNSIPGGAIKDGRGWSAYWVDYKGKVKRKYAAILESQNKPGAGACEVGALSEIEKKFLTIIQGNEYEIVKVKTDPYAAQVNKLSTETDGNVNMDFPYQMPSPPHGDEDPFGGAPAPDGEAEEPPSPPDSRRIRRRYRPVRTVTVQSARRALVDSAQRQADATVSISESLEAISRTQVRIMQLLQQIVNRLHQ